MSNYHQRRAGILPLKQMVAALVVGERVRIVNAPASYGYNGRTGVVEAIDGSQISVRVDEHPADFRCSIFYIEELEREVTS
jgi:ribosomal protein L21E